MYDIAGVVLSFALSSLLLASGLALSKMFLKQESSWFFHLTSACVLASAALFFPSMIIGLTGIPHILDYWYVAEVVILATITAAGAYRTATRHAWKGGSTFTLVLVIVAMLLGAPLLILAVQNGGVSWDSLYWYVYYAKVFVTKGYIPSLDPQRIGSFVAGPPFSSILYSFGMSFGTVPDSDFVIFPLLYALGTAAGVGYLTEKLMESEGYGLLAFSASLSLPALTYYFLFHPMYADLFSCFFYIASILYLVAFLKEGRTGMSSALAGMFWISLSLMLMSDYIGFYFIPSYFLIVAYYSKRVSISAFYFLFWAAAISAATASQSYQAILIPWYEPFADFLVLSGLTALILVRVNHQAGLELTAISKNLFRRSTAILVLPFIWFLRTAEVAGNPFYPYSVVSLSGIWTAHPVALASGAVLLIGCLAGARYLLRYSAKRRGAKGSMFDRSSVAAADTLALAMILVGLFLEALMLGLAWFEPGSIPIPTFNLLPVFPSSVFIYLLASPFAGPYLAVPRLLGFVSAVRSKWGSETLLLLIPIAAAQPWSFLAEQSIRYALISMMLSVPLAILGIKAVVSKAGGRPTLTLFLSVVLLTTAAAALTLGPITLSSAEVGFGPITLLLNRLESLTVVGSTVAHLGHGISLTFLLVPLTMMIVVAYFVGLVLLVRLSRSLA